MDKITEQDNLTEGRAESLKELRDQLLGENENIKLPNIPTQLTQNERYICLGFLSKVALLDTKKDSVLLLATDFLREYFIDPSDAVIKYISSSSLYLEKNTYKLNLDFKGTNMEKKDFNYENPDYLNNQIRQDNFQRLEDNLVRLTNEIVLEDYFKALMSFSEIETILDRSSKYGFEFFRKVQAEIDLHFDTLRDELVSSKALNANNALAVRLFEKLNKLSMKKESEPGNLISFKNGKTFRIDSYYTEPLKGDSERPEAILTTDITAEKGAHPETVKNGHFIVNLKKWIEDGVATSLTLDINYYRSLVNDYNLRESKPLVEDKSNPMANEIVYSVLAVKDRFEMIGLIRFLDLMDSILNNENGNKAFFLVKEFLKQYGNENFQDANFDTDATLIDITIRSFFNKPENLELMVQLGLVSQPYHEPATETKDKMYYEHITYFKSLFALCKSPLELKMLRDYGSLLLQKWYPDNYRNGNHATEKQIEKLEA